MTVVAWDGSTLAADKRTSYGGHHGTVTKIHHLKDGRYAAGCGDAVLCTEFCAWLDAGADPAAFPAAQRDREKCSVMLVVDASGKVLQYEHSPHPITVENRYWAIGSGRDFAMMAMRLGKTADEAVALTAELCHDCGNGVDSVAFCQGSMATKEASPATQELGWNRLDVSFRAPGWADTST